MFELFAEQPCLDLKKGIRVTKETKAEHKSKTSKQALEALKLETELCEEGGNGVNTYTSRAHITINLNEGDILLYDEERGYYLPTYPMTTVEQAAEDLAALKKLVIEE